MLTLLTMGVGGQNYGKHADIILEQFVSIGLEGGLSFSDFSSDCS